MSGLWGLASEMGYGKYGISINITCQAGFSMKVTHAALHS